MAVAPGEQPALRHVIAPQLAAPFHQHLFNVRLDVDVDGAANSVYEVDAHRRAARARTTRGRTPSPGGDTARTEARAPARRRPCHAAGAGRSSTRFGRTASGFRSPTSSSPDRLRRSWPTPTRAWPSEPASPPAICGSLPTAPTNGEPQATIPTSTPAGTGSRVDRGRPLCRRSGHRALVHLRRHPCATARGLAGDAGRVRRIHVDAAWVLRPQPCPRRAAAPGGVSHRLTLRSRRLKPPRPRARSLAFHVTARSGCRPR